MRRARLAIRFGTAKSQHALQELSQWLLIDSYMDSACGCMTGCPAALQLHEIANMAPVILSFLIVRTEQPSASYTTSSQISFKGCGLYTDPAPWKS